MRLSPLLFLFLFAFLEVSLGRRPRVYNALITSDQDLIPSRAYPAVLGSHVILPGVEHHHHHQEIAEYQSYHTVVTPGNQVSSYESNEEYDDYQDVIRKDGQQAANIVYEQNKNSQRYQGDQAIQTNGPSRHAFHSQPQQNVGRSQPQVQPTHYQQPQHNHQQPPQNRQNHQQNHQENHIQHSQKIHGHNPQEHLHPNHGQQHKQPQNYLQPQQPHNVQPEHGQTQHQDKQFPPQLRPVNSLPLNNKPLNNIPVVPPPPIPIRHQ